MVKTLVNILQPIADNKFGVNLQIFIAESKTENYFKMKNKNIRSLNENKTKIKFKYKK